MGFLNKLFNKKKPLKEEEFDVPEINCKWECFACKSGIDPGIHKWTKQAGNYFHKICWKKAIKLANQKNII